MSNTIKDDITYIRQLVEQGRRGPILGGIFLAAAGVVFGATCFVQAAGQYGLLPITGWGIGYLWIAAIAVFAAIWFTLFFRLRGQLSDSTNSSSSVFGMAWSICAIGIMLSFACVIIVSTMTGMPVVMAAYMPIIFVFYGVAWAFSAVTARRSWMYLPAGASSAFALLLAALAQTPLQVAAMGVALLVLLTLPGIRLVKEEER